jgi:hypothetical protein
MKKHKKKTTKPKAKIAAKNSEGNERQEDSLMRQSYREGELQRRFDYKKQS